MRLTLRTLLAYMDDILDPADHEELARKIEASPFATELIHRSRDAIRRLRLSAPEVLAGDAGDLHGGESNLDANTAAEYLDSLLSPEEIADFERSCLEAGPHADMLLAEAVSCHHILTLVLGEPAEVDADLRQRMYALADEPAPTVAQTLRIEPGHTPRPTHEAEAAPEPAHMPRRPQIEAAEAAVPDFILEAAREQRRKQRTLMSVVAAALIGGIATWALWPEGDVEAPREVAKSGVDVESLAEEGAKIDGGTADDAASSATTDSGAATTAGSDEAATVGATGDAATSTAETEAPAFVPTPPAEPAATESAVVATTDESSTGPALTPATEGAAIDEVAADPILPPVEAAEPVDSAAPPIVDETVGASIPDASTPDVSTPDSSTPPPAPAPPADTTASVTPPQLPPQTPPQTLEASDAALAGTPAATSTGVPDDTASAAESDEPPVAEGPKQIGAYLGNNDLLLRYVPSEKNWNRLPPRSSLAPGDRLLALPNFRTHVVLADANVYLGGGTEVDLAAADGGSGEPPADINLVVPYGRLIINSGLNGNRVRLQVGDQTRTLTLGSSSSLAVDVQRTFVPGADPEREPAPMEISWYLTSGSAMPADELEGGEIEGPASWTTTADGEDSVPQAIEELPEWIDREPVSDSQRRALEPVEEALAAGSPVSLRLAELSDPSNLGRRIEVRSLAAEAGAYVGQFDPLVKTLSDVNQKAAWKARIEALREAIARDGAVAVTGIREAFAVQRGEDQADDLMEMLIGFSPEDVGRTRAEVGDGSLVRLVRWLEDDDLTHRVLALHNINTITGTSGLGGFRPEHTADQRRREIQYYWNRLEKGELMPKE